MFIHSGLFFNPGIFGIRVRSKVGSEICICPSSNQFWTEFIIYLNILKIPKSTTYIIKLVKRNQEIFSKYWNILKKSIFSDDFIIPGSRLLNPRISGLENLSESRDFGIGIIPDPSLVLMFNWQSSFLWMDCGPSVDLTRQIEFSFYRQKRLIIVYA